MGLNFSVRGFGNSDQEFANKRFKATPDYAYIRSDVKHTQKLPYDWSLMAKLSGQLASEPLISAEQFTIGGADSVRGYLESTALGDNGLFTSLELHTPQFKKYFNDSVKDLYAFAFVDYGQVSIDDPLPGQEENSNLLSVGLGVNYKGFNGIFSQLDYAHALKNAETGNIQKGDDRLLYSLGYEW
jgi:hemolysin activation/secretion protein